MASLINSIRNISSDTFWVLKLSIFVVALFFLKDKDLNYPTGDPNLVPFFIFVYFVMLGFAGVAMHRNIHNKTPLFPNIFDLPELVWMAVGGTITVLPASFLYYVAFNFVNTNFVFDDFIMFVINLVLLLVFTPFIFTPFVLFTVNRNLFQAFNIMNILEGAGNFIVQAGAYILQYIFTIGILTMLFYYLFVGMLGDHMILLVLKCIVIVISFFSILLYCSDLYEDVIPAIKVKNKSKGNIL
jgi:hypothetical protein